MSSLPVADKKYFSWNKDFNKFKSKLGKDENDIGKIIIWPYFCNIFIET